MEEGGNLKSVLRDKKKVVVHRMVISNPLSKGELNTVESMLKESDPKAALRYNKRFGASGGCSVSTVWW